MGKIPKEISVITSHIEGGCETRKVELLIQSPIRIILFVLLSICSVGLVPLFCLWNFKVRKFLLYDYADDLEKSTHFLVFNEDGVTTIEPKKEFQTHNLATNEAQKQIGFNNRKLSFVLKTTFEGTKAFKAVEYPISEIQFSELGDKSIILNEARVVERRKEFGSNERKLQTPNLFLFLLREFLTPFYLLQFASIGIWLVQEYYQFAYFIGGLQLIVSVFSFFMVRQFYKKIQKLDSANTFNVTVIRQEHPQGIKVSSTDLVVGDVIILKNRSTIPCDCLLISGQLEMNEVSLTGESIPISKIPLPNSDTLFDYLLSDHTSYFLYDGTKIFQQKLGDDNLVLARVVRVGFSSFKGQIMRSVLYPRPLAFDYNKNIFKFLISLGIFALLVFLIRIKQMIDVKSHGVLYFFRFFDTVTWVIPPFLPIFQAISLIASQFRLKRKGISSVEPFKSLVAGKVTVMCFDKTGTLTTNGIDMNGHYDETLTKMIKKDKSKMKELSSSIQFKLFATCHSVRYMNEQFVGDILDIEMRKYSGYTYQASEEENIRFVATQGENTLHVLKLFEFDKDLARLSVIVRDLQLKKTFIFTKGAPDRLNDILIRETMPRNFTDKLNNLALKGFRVLGMGYKEIDESTIDFADPKRMEIESDLSFLGFIVLENNLKPDTAESIERLKQSNIDCKIITGDNPFTATSTATDCNIFDSSKPISLLKMHANSVILQTIENEIIQPHDKKKSLEQIIQAILSEKKQLVITGKVLEHFEASMIQSNRAKGNVVVKEGFTSPQINILSIGGDEESMTSNHVMTIEILQKLIARANVLARMTPNQKRRIIEILQLQNLKVGMIGDGANDCEAIKQADIGISFSSADAAQTAPFTSNSESIGCVETILTDGRGTMSNNIEIFKNIVIQNILKFIGCAIMIQNAENYGDNQFFFLSFLGGMILLLLLSFSVPQKSLSKIVPNTDFHKLQFWLSMFSQIFVYFLAMILACLVHSKNFQQNYQMEEAEFFGIKFGIPRKNGTLNAIIFFMTFAFYLSSVLSFYTSVPFKVRLYRNYPVSIALVAYSIGWISLLYLGFLNKSFVISEESFKSEVVHIYFGITIGAIVLVCLIEWLINHVFSKNAGITNASEQDKETVNIELTNNGDVKFKGANIANTNIPSSSKENNK